MGLQDVRSTHGGLTKKQNATRTTFRIKYGPSKSNRIHLTYGLWRPGKHKGR